jgi:mRNA interferase HigB
LAGEPSSIGTKQSHRNAGLLPNNRVEFNIKGDDYRLVVAVHYNRGIIFVRFIGTHRQYDRIDATTV